MRCPVKDTLGILKSRDRLEIQTITEAAYLVMVLMVVIRIMRFIRLNRREKTNRMRYILVKEPSNKLEDT